MRVGLLVLGILTAGAASALAGEPPGEMPWVLASATPTATLSAPPAGQPADQSQWVSRQEYEALKKQLDTVLNRLNAVEAKGDASDKVATEYMENLDKELSKISLQMKANQPGTDLFLFTGDIGVGFTNTRGASSSFNAGFSPLMLWHVNDKILVEAALDLSLSNDPEGGSANTTTDLALANISYELCDYLLVGGGLFTVPFGRYHSHFDPRWINKLPDDPLAFGDRGIAPGGGTGVFAMGAAPLGTTEINYAIYATNGGTLDSGATGGNAGELLFDNFQDANQDKAVGGRVGWRPFNDLEVGYSFQYSHPGLKGFKEVESFLHGLDVNYVKDIDAIKGTLTARAEWIWSRVGRATYDPTGALGFGPTTFNNDRDGGYVLVAYRPTKVDNEYLKKTEFVFRFDRVNVSSQAPGGGSENRWTPGIDYWLTPSAVIKVAYEFDQRTNGDNSNGLLIVFAVGY